MRFGLRIIKTVIAVALCLIIDIFRQGMPFFAVVAAILCLQKDKEMTYRQALNRGLGTFIGGGVGLISLVLFQSLGINYGSLLYIAIISLMAMPIININLLLKTPFSAGFSCVVYYSVVIGHFEDLKVLSFVQSRITDTLIGIAVALLINLAFPFKGGKEVPLA